MKAVQEEEVLRGVGFVKQVGFEPGVKERQLWMSRVVNQKRRIDELMSSTVSLKCPKLCDAFVFSVPRYFSSSRWVKYCDQHVCLSACMSQKLYVQILQNFCMCYMWPWLGRPLMAMQYVVYFQFCRRCHVFT